MGIIADYLVEAERVKNRGSRKEIVRKLIDLTLDTRRVENYAKTCELLDQLDQSGEGSGADAYVAAWLTDLITQLHDIEVVNPQTLLSATALKKRYQRGGFSFGPLTMQLAEGEIIGLVGENGNGKTTLLRLLCGELKPDGGELKYLFPYKDSYDLRTKLIYIPQRGRDWSGSLLNNLRFTASSYGITGDENRYLVELIIARMGLRPYRTFSWEQLSSGYKMRFELARMLLRKPRLLLIDEPLANLDIVSQQLILSDLRELAGTPYRPMGVVLSSQQLYEVEKSSDRVIFLKDGQTGPEALDTTDESEQVTERKRMVEFETTLPYEELQQLLTSLRVESLQLTGGTYLAVFPLEITTLDLFQFFIENKLTVTYFRDISNSTRRFFLS